MPLILTSTLYYDPLPENIRKEFNVSNFYLEVSKKYLSDYFTLKTGSSVEGK